MTSMAVLTREVIKYGFQGAMEIAIMRKRVIG